LITLKTVTGKICDIVKRGRGQFGFIHIGEGPKRSDTPRIYFSFKDFTETKFPPRRGYLVEFECAKDQSNRSYAANVKLTEEGLKEAEERDLKYMINPDNKRESTGGERKPRRDEMEGRNIVLMVTCEGESETKQITANVAHSIGKLKHLAGAPMEFNVFCHITPETPDGVLLSRAILNEMSDNEMIHIKQAPEGMAPRKKE
jgi:hypothetical protein